MLEKSFSMEWSQLKMEIEKTRNGGNEREDQGTNKIIKNI